MNEFICVKHDSSACNECVKDFIFAEAGWKRSVDYANEKLKYERERNKKLLKGIEDIKKHQQIVAGNMIVRSGVMTIVERILSEYHQSQVGKPGEKE